MTSPYTPHYHFFPQRDFMNDPNGLVYFEGEYHLFYQHLLPKHWGHAVSTNLVHWQILPPALRPNELGDIWSGSVVTDDNNRSGFFPDGSGLVAIFTQQHAEHVAPIGPQIQSIAYSSDRGRTWTMYERNPVIPNPGERDFRDPYVFWHAASDAWVMVVTFGSDQVRIYRSLDLKQWELASAFGPGEGDHSGCWECPSLCEVPVDGDPANTRWLLHLSMTHGEHIQSASPEMQYFIGSFDGYTFTNSNAPEAILWSDYGKDNYAAVSWNNIPPQDGRRIGIGWCNNWRYAGKLPTGEWQGMMTIPRTLHLQSGPDGIRLYQRPIVELQQLREQSFRLEPCELTSENEIVLPVQAKVFEMIAGFRPGDADEFGVQVRVGAEAFTTIGYERATSSVFVDRRWSGKQTFDTTFPARHRASLPLDENLLTLHLFIDSSSIEVFANDGAVVISDLIFPDPDSQQIHLYARNGNAELCELEVHMLRQV